MADDLLRTHVIRVLAAKETLPVRYLFQLIKEDIPSLTEDALAQEIETLQSEGAISLESVRIESSFFMFLSDWERNMDFYLVLALSLGALFMSATSLPYPYIFARWVLDLIFVFFVPGYATVTALSLRNFTLTETVLLSVGLSLAILMFLGLILSLLPWGISIASSGFGLALYTISVSFVGRWQAYASNPASGRS